VREAAVVMEEVCRSGAHAGACHAQMYVMGSVLRHGSDAQKQRYLPAIASGELRLQSFGVTEPTTGTDTTNLKTTARRDGDVYRINGQKVWISRIEHSDLMVLLARTTPRDQVAKKTQGCRPSSSTCTGGGQGPDHPPHRVDDQSPFLRAVLRRRGGARGQPAGPEGARVQGDPRRHERRAHSHCRRMRGRRPLLHRQGLGLRQGAGGVRSAHRPEPGRAVSHRPLLRRGGGRRADGGEGGALFDAGEPCGAEANMAKMLASEASWRAGDVCMQTHGGFAFAKEYHIERKFRETRLYQIAPISTNLILSYIGEHVLGMPRSF
jgi:acyl-CoA dehydrogenase